MPCEYIGYDDWSNGATITDFSAENSNFPIANLLLPHPTDRYEVTATSWYIVLDTGSVKRLRAVALPYTNATSGSVTWQIRTDNTEGQITGASPTGPFSYDSGSQTFWPTTDYGTAPTNARHGFWRLPDAAIPVSTGNRYVRIDYSDSAAGTIRAGNLLVCNNDPFAVRGLSYGSDFAGFVDRSRVSASARGRLSTTRGYVARQFQLRGNANTEADLHTLLELFENQGGSRNCVFVRNQDATTRFEHGLMLGLLDTRLKVRQNEFSQFEFSVNITER